MKISVRPLWAPISGETPIDDVSELIPQNIQLRADLNLVESDNIAQVFAKYLVGRFAPIQFDMAWVKSLHKEMFCDVWKWAGRLRDHTLNIGSHPHQIEAELLSLMEDVAVWQFSNQYPLIVSAATLHHRAVKIHPFINGNGRWSRMLANVYMKMHGGNPTQWPEPTMGAVSDIREAYIHAVKAADAGDMKPLVKLHYDYAV